MKNPKEPPSEFWGEVPPKRRSSKTIALLAIGTGVAAFGAGLMINGCNQDENVAQGENGVAGSNGVRHHGGGFFFGRFLGGYGGGGGVRSAGPSVGASARGGFGATGHGVGVGA